MPQWQSLFALLSENGINVSAADVPRPVAGGYCSTAWRVQAKDHCVFLKTGTADVLPMLQAEADGLRTLEKAAAVRVPRVLGCFSSDSVSLLALEWLDLEPANDGLDEKLGQQLAAQHRHRAGKFGWHRDNTLGLTPQHNPCSDDWLQFFADHRLGYQLDLAASNGFTGALQIEGAILRQNLGRFFTDYRPDASLLHGDLWAGNKAGVNGTPVIFDPAVYYGDRESDIAMSKLFGGFSDVFYAAYEESWPLSAGSDERILLYQLYYVLNHLNLFGGTYLQQALVIIRQLSCR